MNTKKGFSLIELMIYLVIVCGIVLMLFQLIVNATIRLTTVRKQAHLCTMFYSTCARIMRDVQAAPAQDHYWKKITDHECIWHTTDEYDLGWYLEGNILYRLKGIYDATKQTWKKKTRQCVLTNVDSCLFNAHKKDQTISALTITVAIKLPDNNLSTKTLIVTPHAMVQV